MIESHQNKLGWSLIPPAILGAEDLSSTQKILWGRICGLSGEKGYCWATNDWIAEQLNIKPQTVSVIVSDMVDKGYVRRQLVRDEGGRVVERRLFPTPFENNQGGPLEKTHTPFEENQKRVLENIEVEKETFNTNVTNVVENDEEEITPRDAEIQDVFTFWRDEREKALDLDLRGPRMKLSDKRRSKVNARLDDGYTPIQLKEAVMGCLTSKYHLENGYTDLELICRNQQKVNQFRAKFKQWFKQQREYEKAKRSKNNSLKSIKDSISEVIE